MMLFIIVVLFCYGTYHLLCYIFMQSTAMSGRRILTINASERISSFDVVAIRVAEGMAEKWDLHLNNAEKLDTQLKQKGVYVEGTIFLISKLLLFVMGLFLLVPVLFINKAIFLFLCCLWSCYTIVPIIRLYETDSIKEKFKLKIRRIGCQLLLGAFFIAQIYVFLVLLT